MVDPNATQKFLRAAQKLVIMLIVKNPLRRLPVLFFFDGVLAAFLIVVIVAANREDRLLDELKRQVEIRAGTNAPPVTVVAGAMHVIHSIGPLPSSPAHLLSGYAAFGTYSNALARLLTNYGYRVRIGQMQVHGDSSSRSIVEAQVDERWITLDPEQDLVVNPQLRHEAIRYTAWGKIVVAIPVYDLYFYSGLFVFVLLNIYLYRGARGSLPWQKAAMRQMMRKQGLQ